MYCRQSKAERLTALALGYTLANAIRRARDGLYPRTTARDAANAGNWQEAARITGAAIRTALGATHDALNEDRNSLYNRALQPVFQLSTHTGHATSNLHMAQECLDGTYEPLPVNPHYKARNHLWNCQIMAITGALNAMADDGQALSQAAAVANHPCTHTAQREWTEREKTRIPADPQSHHKTNIPKQSGGHPP